VDRIEAAGLVRREPVPGDRRGVRVVLTSEGRRRHDEAFVEHLRLIEREISSRLTTNQQKAVADTLAGFWHEKGGLRRWMDATYRPQTNGKAERLVRTLLAEWAYAEPFT
jgi:DNA-binding MarR family transcriptional regulator